MSEEGTIPDLESFYLAVSTNDAVVSDLARSEISQTSSSIEFPQENVEFARVREHWRQNLAVELRAGDLVHMISAHFITQLLEFPALSVDELAAHLGKIDNTAIVDMEGNLYPERSEPVPTTCILSELYDELVLRFGAAGNPVVRVMIADPQGQLILERYAPFFIVHTLSKGTVAARTAAHSRTQFLLLQTKTFSDLKLHIVSNLYKVRPPPVRVWFITSENIEELPAIIPVSVFINKIQFKKLVGPKVLDCTLQSQGVSSLRLHLVVEVMDKSTRKFPVDLALSATNIELLDFETVVSSGGNLGLSNLGNTCYMNSALQCLVHLPEINYYFFFDLYEKELNRTNPLGNKGEVAVAFSNLLHKLFDSTSSSSYVTPREFKYTLGRYSSMFHGYQQQDSQEFLSWLLDALHEDLNRIHDKPYCEKPELKDEDVNDPQAIVDLANQCWNQHKLRNDSIIVDLFTGLYESTLVCPECDKKSVTFDPFNDLTLPLPINKKWYHEFTVVDLSHGVTEHRILKLEVELTKSSNYDDLLTYLSSFLKVGKNDLFLFEVFRNLFYKNFQENGNRSSFMPITELISDSDTVVVYIIPHNPETDFIVPVINVIQDEDRSYNIKDAFGLPLFVVLNKEADTQSFGKIRQKLEQTVKYLSRADLQADYAKIKDESKKFHAADEFPLIKRPVFEDAVMVCDSSESNEACDLPKSENRELDGYDSDISLADPNVSASFGFEIKYYEEDPSKRHIKGMGNRFGRGNTVNSEPQHNVIHVPHGRPHFDRLPTLATKLPELKRNYYHYPEYAAKFASKTQEGLKDIAVDEEERNGYVMVNHEKQEETAPSDDARYSLPDEETDSDSNWDNMNTLFASVDRLGPVAPPVSDSDREVNSDVPSPLEKGPVKVDHHVPLVNSHTTLVLDWDVQIHSEFFKEPDHQAWENLQEIPNPELEASKRKLALQQKSTVSLYDCLRNFSTPEVLGDQDLWYCPRCKEHRRATKTIQIWSTGDILTIHLKRFLSARSFSDKINMVVDFPIEGLDMSEFVMSSQVSGQENKQDLIYDLVAVDNHYGGLGGGHYTASGKNFRDNKWYYFNDGRVTPINDPKECVTGAAYLLFYKKRSSSLFAGGDAVRDLLSEGRRAFAAKLNALKELLLQVMQEIEEHQKQLAEVNEALRKKEEQSSSNSDDDLYGDNDDQSPLKDSASESTSAVSAIQSRPVPEIPQNSQAPEGSKATKKSRSPMAELAMEFEFENQRKQRLILKDVDLPRLVNINMGYSSSVSNLASPTGSSEEGELD